MTRRFGFLLLILLAVPTLAEEEETTIIPKSSEKTEIKENQDETLIKSVEDSAAEQTESPFRDVPVSTVSPPSDKSRNYDGDLLAESNSHSKPTNGIRPNIQPADKELRIRPNYETENSNSSVISEKPQKAIESPQPSGYGPTAEVNSVASMKRRQVGQTSDLPPYSSNSEDGYSSRPPRQHQKAPYDVQMHRQQQQTTTTPATSANDSKEYQKPVELPKEKPLGTIPSESPKPKSVEANYGHQTEVVPSGYEGAENSHKTDYSKTQNSKPTVYSSTPSYSAAVSPPPFAHSIQSVTSHPTENNYGSQPSGYSAKSKPLQPSGYLTAPPTFNRPQNYQNKYSHSQQPYRPSLPNYRRPQSPAYGYTPQPNYGRPQQQNYGRPQISNYGRPQIPPNYIPQQQQYSRSNYGRPQPATYVRQFPSGYSQNSIYGNRQPTYQQPQALVGKQMGGNYAQPSGQKSQYSQPAATTQRGVYSPSPQRGGYTRMPQKGGYSQIPNSYPTAASARQSIGRMSQQYSRPGPISQPMGGYTQRPSSYAMPQTIRPTYNRPTMAPTRQTLPSYSMNTPKPSTPSYPSASRRPSINTYRPPQQPTTPSSYPMASAQPNTGYRM